MLGVHGLDAEEHEGPGPVDGLGDGGVLLEIERAERADDTGDLVGELGGDAGDLGEHDRPLALERGVVEVEEKAAALQGLRQLTGVVGGEEHERYLVGRDGAELGDRDLIVREDLEQERLGLDLETIDLVHEEHDRIGGADRLEQRAGRAGTPRRRGPPRATPIRAAPAPSEPSARRSTWMRSSCFL